jgi:hypothetical protein
LIAQLTGVTPELEDAHIVAIPDIGLGPLHDFPRANGASKLQSVELQTQNGAWLETYTEPRAILKVKRRA